MKDLQIITSIDELLVEWEQEFCNDIDIFIRDGIVCEEEYADPHVLFVMRDMNAREKSDLRKELFETGSGWPTWNNAARWATALLTGDDQYPREIDRCLVMRRVSVVNIKKQAGGARAYKEELIEAAKKYGAYTLREIELCNPDIIVCGGFGNATILKDHVFKDLAGEWQKITAESFNDIWWYYFVNINGKQIPVINFCHPQVTHYKGKRGHEGLFEPLYREMLKIRKVFLEK